MQGTQVKQASLIAVTCCIALAPARAAEGIVTYKSLAPDVAFDLAQSALQQCRKDGYQIAVVVSDRFGAPLVELRDRYTPVGALDIAKGKAWTSITFTRNTSDFAKAIKDGRIGAGLVGLPGVTPLAGGVVIEAGGSLLGAVGVAGAPGGDKDEACAKAGVEAVQDKFEF
ncbi:heme-binding protein [Bradyrhizobium jicamae]|uniref:Heme-binding protein n=2 Tax=Bradyrhizobium jicamae TaxID=280332 RepID=A0ABS5FY45_9BRAD|nr:heme-binding protein [Bradyrhizobium jicamae]